MAVLEDRKQLAKLKGGQKRLWLKQHRGDILEFCDKYGDEATLKRFRMGPYVLYRLQLGYREEYKPKPVSNDRIRTEIKIVKEDVVDLRNEVIEVKEQFSKFQETVSQQLIRNFFLPLLQAGIKLPEDLKYKPSPDPVNIDALLKQLRGKLQGTPISTIKDTMDKSLLSTKRLKETYLSAHPMAQGVTK